MSAVNVALPAFAAAVPAVQQSIDNSYSPDPQQQTQAVGEWDRQMDGHRTIT